MRYSFMPIGPCLDGEVWTCVLRTTGVFRIAGWTYQDDKCLVTADPHAWILESFMIGPHEQLVCEVPMLSLVQIDDFICDIVSPWVDVQARWRCIKSRARAEHFHLFGTEITPEEDVRRPLPKFTL